MIMTNSSKTRSDRSISYSRSFDDVSHASNSFSVANLPRANAHCCGVSAVSASVRAMCLWSANHTRRSSGAVFLGIAESG